MVEGELVPWREIAIRIDQTLTQDATGTLVMLELEAMDLDRVRTELSAQYVDHNLIQSDFRNPDDQLFLRSACRRFGVWYSRAGNGVSHPVPMERFGPRASGPPVRRVRPRPATVVGELPAGVHAHGPH
jgi:aconitate hydratase